MSGSNPSLDTKSLRIKPAPGKDLTATPPKEIAFYYPNPLWRQGDWIKMILFFDGVALLVPSYMRTNRTSAARRLGVGDCCDIKENVAGGVRYLAWLLRKFRGDMRLAAAAYYAERPFDLRQSAIFDRLHTRANTTCFFFRRRLDAPGTRTAAGPLASYAHS